MKTRKAVYAGRFYPDTAKNLEQLLSKIMLAETTKIDRSLSSKQLLGAVVPHAGYIYSAYEAVHVFEILKNSTEQFDTFIIINPNHTGTGHTDFNISSADYWETPLGQIPTDREFSEALSIEINDQAHQNEHSGEVQLPFLQYFLPYTFKIVMITMNRQTADNAQKLANTIIETVHKTHRKVFLIASSDFSHYEQPDEGFRKDQLVVNELLKFNIEGIYQQVKKHHITACGYGPIMTLAAYSKLAVAHPNIQQLRRGHSGEIYPSNEVVDYISFLCYS